MRLLHALATLTVAVSVLVGCGLTGPDPDEIVVFEIGPTTVDCMGEFPQRCMLVRSDPSEEWSFFYGPIEGFTHEEGFLFRVEVLRRKVQNPPADGSSLEYRLIRILSREPV